MGAETGSQCPPAWSYEKQHSWGGACATGKMQSPIAVAVVDEKAATLSLPPLLFHYIPFIGRVLNTSRTLEVVIPAEAAESVDRARSSYVLREFHFHFPAEHKHGTVTHSGELHFVHQDKVTKRYFVVAVWIEAGKANPALDPIVGLARDLKGCQTSTASTKIDPAKILPDPFSYATYNGSLTTPPCTEGVTVVILDNVITASKEQIAVLSRGEKNARDVQPRGGRLIHRRN